MKNNLAQIDTNMAQQHLFMIGKFNYIQKKTNSLLGT